MVESNDAYRKLQLHIDERMPVGFPRSESVADIRILKQLFTPKEVNLVLYISTLPELIEYNKSVFYKEFFRSNS